MKRCFELAETARREGESTVGSLVVKNGEIIGEGTEKSRQLNDLTRHAEVMAIRDALKKTDDLKGTTLYTNVEPCVLCSYIIRQRGIGEVVFAKHAGELGGSARFKILTTDGIDSWGKPPKIRIHPSGD